MKNRQSNEFDILDSYSDDILDTYNVTSPDSTLSFDVMKEYLPQVRIDLDDLNITNYQNFESHAKAESYTVPKKQPEQTLKIAEPTMLKPADLVPVLHEGPKGTGTYHAIIQEAIRKQKEAQQVFRNMNTKLDRIEPLLHPPPSLVSIPPPPPEEPPKVLVPKRQVGSSMSTLLDPKKVSEQARNERLASLGIFEVQPRASKPSTNSNVDTIPLHSFATPLHQKPTQVEKIHEITGPTLISTSSKIETVPISEILKDLKAAGRLVEEKRGLKQFFKK